MRVAVWQPTHETVPLDDNRDRFGFGDIPQLVTLHIEGRNHADDGKSTIPHP